MGNDVLEKFGNSLLVDKYDVYDQLMNYCAETMQDDLYLIQSDGWVVRAYIPQPSEKKKNEGGEVSKSQKEKEAKSIHDIACDLLPVECVVEKYFQREKEKISFLEKKLLSAEVELNELCEEYADGYLEPTNFKDEKLNKANVQKRLKEVGGKEASVLQSYLNYSDIIVDYKKQLKSENSDLLDVVLKKYTTLSEEDIKNLVTNKWTSAFGIRLAMEIQHISQSLNSQLIDLEERYEQTLPEINAEVERLETKVMKHLEKIGFEL
jgi:type I restriction enzyme M protein